MVPFVRWRIQHAGHETGTQAGKTAAGACVRAHPWCSSTSTGPAPSAAATKPGVPRGRRLPPSAPPPVAARLPCLKGMQIAQVLKRRRGEPQASSSQNVCRHGPAVAVAATAAPPQPAYGPSPLPTCKGPVLQCAEQGVDVGQLVLVGAHGRTCRAGGTRAPVTALQNEPQNCTGLGHRLRGLSRQTPFHAQTSLQHARGPGLPTCDTPPVHSLHALGHGASGRQGAHHLRLVDDKPPPVQLQGCSRKA